MLNKLDDEIVEEIRRRRRHAESLDYSVNRIVEDLQRQERASGVTVVERAPRSPRVEAKQSST